MIYSNIATAWTYSWVMDLTVLRIQNCDCYNYFNRNGRKCSSNHPHNRKIWVNFRRDKTKKVRYNKGSPKLQKLALLASEALLQKILVVQCYSQWVQSSWTSDSKCKHSNEHLATISSFLCIFLLVVSGAQCIKLGRKPSKKVKHHEPIFEFWGDAPSLTLRKIDPVFLFRNFDKT